MESSGNAVVDFGRFCTGFLVVMGIGMFYLPYSWLCWGGFGMVVGEVRGRGRCPCLASAIRVGTES